ncbi:hypothetical protein Bbelb_381770 [Branchiostoma belcheri]|nr:hypothetical protein Bbelb_381770 [Branchiostoma belcheri]
MATAEPIEDPEEPGAEDNWDPDAKEPERTVGEDCYDPSCPVTNPDGTSWAERAQHAGMSTWVVNPPEYAYYKYKKGEVERSIRGLRRVIGLLKREEAGAPETRCLYNYLWEYAPGRRDIPDKRTRAMEAFVSCWGPHPRFNIVDRINNLHQWCTESLRPINLTTRGSPASRPGQTVLRIQPEKVTPSDSTNPGTMSHGVGMGDYRDNRRYSAPSRGDRHAACNIAEASELLNKTEERAGILSIEAMLLKIQLRWAGHVSRTEGHRLPKICPLRRSFHRGLKQRKKRFKDSLKKSLSSCNIDHSHLPAATVAEYAGHALALSATNGRAAGEGWAPEIFGNEAKPRRRRPERHKIGGIQGLEPGTSRFRVAHSVAATPHDPTVPVLSSLMEGGCIWSPRIGLCRIDDVMLPLTPML